MATRFSFAVLLIAALALLPAPTPTGAQAPDPAVPRPADPRDWIQLFNGKDLADWTIKFAKHNLGENLYNTFRAEDGLLKVRYDQWPSFNAEFGHIFYKDAFSYYLLAAEYRFVEQQVAGAPAWANRNNGLMLHSPHPGTMLKDQDFPISLEVQLLGGLGAGPRTTANLCTPGTHVVKRGSCTRRTAPTRHRRPTTATSGCASKCSCTATSSCATSWTERPCWSTRSRRSAGVRRARSIRLSRLTESR